MRPDNLKHVKQEGLTLIETAIVIVLMAVIVLGGMRIVPNIQFSIKASELTNEVNEIRTAAVKWKAARATFAGVDINTLCTGGRQLLTESTCGASNDGSVAVPWGGNYDLNVNPADASRFDVTIGGLPQNRVLELADSLAPFTYDRCSSADACLTAVATGMSNTPGNGGQIVLTF
ncbi:type II secretion system protein [Vibrio sp. PNB22_3_1]